jgi:uncharacterized membrane protein
MPTPEAEVVKKVAEDSPFVVQNLIPTLWMLGVAAAGGAVSFYQKVKAGKVREYMTAAAVAITGHMGARAIFLAEQFIERRAGKE